jgi:hypothetical protein
VLVVAVATYVLSDSLIDRFGVGVFAAGVAVVVALIVVWSIAICVHRLRPGNGSGARPIVARRSARWFGSRHPSSGGLGGRSRRSRKPG